MVTKCVQKLKKNFKMLKRSFLPASSILLLLIKLLLILKTNLALKGLKSC